MLTSPNESEPFQIEAIRELLWSSYVRCRTREYGASPVPTMDGIGLEMEDEKRAPAMLGLSS